MISIIIPLYNKSQYVNRSFESIISQSFTDWELIIIDDGSRDDSLKVVKKFVSEQELDIQTKCHLFQQPNSGVSTTRNRGVELAHGEWIAFLDADDWWDPDFLKEMWLFTQNSPNGGIYGCSYTIVDHQKTRVANIGVPKDFQLGEINYFETYAKTLNMPLWTGSVLIPKSVFHSVGGFNPTLKMGEDFDLWCRIALSYPVYFLNKALAYYNQEIDIHERAVGKLHIPKHHFLFHLDAYQVVEERRADVKQLFDDLRVYGLMLYYLSNDYHVLAKIELEKVDWSKQTKDWQQLYKKPVSYLKMRRWVMERGAVIKNYLRKIVS